VIAVDGQQLGIPGLITQSFLEDPRLRLKMGEDGSKRTERWIRGIVLHTTCGKHPQRITPGLGPPGNAAEANVRYWTGSKASAGAALLVDFDGSIVCTVDIVREQTYHAESVNGVTVGIEIVQRADGSMFSVQLDCAVRLIDWLTRTLGIQRQIQWPYHDGPVARIHAGGKDVVGIYGHRDQTSGRGAGDPGNAIFDRLIAAGYERFDFATEIDISTWQQRQIALGMGTKNADGIPGPATCAAILTAGHKHGLWLERPGD
jgi:hypothetical protein